MAEDSLATVGSTCSNNTPPINVQTLIANTQRLASNGSIDPLTYLTNTSAYIYGNRNTVFDDNI